MNKELPKTYDPKSVEDKIYESWEKSGIFNPDNLEKIDSRYEKARPFTIMMPPPNVTGNLHVGHALFVTLEDIMTRHARMQGKKALWLPGTDHAGIATNFVVERKLWNEQKKTRHEIGREAFLKMVDEWITETKGNIQNQIRKMGASCDWSREKYTFSEQLSVSVNTMFKNMYDAGLIYRGGRIVNWCPRCSTTLANDEVEHKTTTDPLYYIKYPLVNSDKSITVATVRPETMLGDTGVAVNPKDKKYKTLIGKTVMLPIVNREIPIVADKEIDPEFGSGAVKVTPGHSEADFGIGKRNKLDTISFIDKTGKIDEAAALDFGFEQFANLTVEKARDKVVQALKDGGFLEKQEDYQHNVSLCYRCDTVVEPMISKQWFIDVNKKFKIENPEFKKQLKLKNSSTTLKEIGIATVKSGSIKIVPERFEKIYLNWLENLYDWNISRQLWFGHQLPVWYPPEAQNAEDSNEVYVGNEPPENWVQDTDTLDTWFSSSLWTFSTLGWPEKTNDLSTHHPTDILETAYDIIFFWVARMILMTGFAMQQIPFKTVYLHGLVRDEKGEKMSKSKGNVLDPLIMINKYGTDALRLSLLIGSTPGNDQKISENKIASYRNFANKLWNISRFILSRTEKPELITSEPKPKTLSDAWILEQLNNTTFEVGELLEKNQYGLAAEKLEQFTWSDFADWYLEISKVGSQTANQETEKILNYTLQTLLKLWHPFIPFITEHIWKQFSEKTIMIQDYPTAEKPRKKANQGFARLQELIRGIRNLKTEYQVPPSKSVAAYIDLDKKQGWVKSETELIEQLSRVNLNFDTVASDKKMPYFIWEGIKIFIIVPDFDPEKELLRAEKELTKNQGLADKLKKQLKNKHFLEKAPEEVVEKMKREFEQAELQTDKLKTKIKSLK